MESWREGGDAQREHALAVLEELKRELRERAAIVVARERELAELRRQVEQQLAGATAAPSEGRTTKLERELAEKIAAAERREREAAAELALAQAERERLEERERVVHEVERELAGLRVRLNEERERLEGSTTQPTVREPRIGPKAKPAT